MRIIRALGDDEKIFYGAAIDDFTAAFLGDSLTAAVDERRGEHMRVHRLLAPIVPPNILCVGRNYPQSGDGTADGELELFMKPTTSVQRPGGPIMIPEGGHVHVEGELAVVIGATTRAVSEADAARNILGYTLANDVTDRRWQTREGPPLWMRGKGFDTFSPIGPAVVTLDEIDDASDLTVRTLINGRTVRQGSTHSMIRRAARIVSEISHRMTLPAGTVILTGAAPLVPGAEDRPVKPGDRIEVECPGLGRLINPVSTEQASRDR